MNATEYTETLLAKTRGAPLREPGVMYAVLAALSQPVTLSTDCLVIRVDDAFRLTLNPEYVFEHKLTVPQLAALIHHEALHYMHRVAPNQ